jgi:hypothetical protein
MRARVDGMSFIFESGRCYDRTVLCLYRKKRLWQATAAEKSSPVLVGGIENDLVARLDRGFDRLVVDVSHG